MPPKGALRPPCKLGFVQEHFGGYRLGLSAMPDQRTGNTWGKRRPTEAEANEDLAKAQACASRKDMLEFVRGLKGGIAPGMKRNNIADGIKRNDGHKKDLEQHAQEHADSHHEGDVTVTVPDEDAEDVDCSLGVDEAADEAYAKEEFEEELIATIAASGGQSDRTHMAEQPAEFPVLQLPPPPPIFAVRSPKNAMASAPYCPACCLPPDQSHPPTCPEDPRGRTCTNGTQDSGRVGVLRVPLHANCRSGFDPQWIVGCFLLLEEQKQKATSRPMNRIAIRDGKLIIWAMEGTYLTL